MKPVLLLTVCLATALRAQEPVAPAAAPAPGHPAERAAPEAVTGPAAAGDTAPAAPRFQLAPATAASPAQQQVTAALPKFDPDAPKENRTLESPGADVLELPKITVRPRARPRLQPGIVITNKGLEAKASPLDGKLLNNFTLPGWMGGQTAAERAREEQRRKEKDVLTQDVNTIAKAVEVVDPAQAKALRDAVSKP